MDELFDGLTARQRERLLQNFEARYLSYRKDATILSNHKKENYFCIIEQGSLQIIVYDLDGNRIIIEELTAGNIFNSHFYDEFNGEYDIVCKTECRIILIDFVDILSARNSGVAYETFYKNLVNICFSVIRDKNQHINVLTRKTTRDKLLAYFRSLYQKALSRNIYLPFSFKELADYLSVNRSSMMREIKFLKEERLIEVKGRRIKILYDID